MQSLRLATHRDSIDRSISHSVLHKFALQKNIYLLKGIFQIEHRFIYVLLCCADLVTPGTSRSILPKKVRGTQFSQVIASSILVSHAANGYMHFAMYLITINFGSHLDLQAAMSGIYSVCLSIREQIIFFKMEL